MPRNYVKGRQEQIPGTYENRKHYAIKSMTGETNIWGRKVNPEISELREKMWDRFPGISQYRMPREVADRVDINLYAKMVFSFLSNFPLGVRATMAEIGGMCGLSIYQVASGVYDLEQQGLLEWHQHRVEAPNNKYYATASWYKVITPPKRHRRKEPPKFIKTDISDLEEIVNAKFYET